MNKNRRLADYDVADSSEANPFRTLMHASRVRCRRLHTRLIVFTGRDWWSPLYMADLSQCNTMPQNAMQPTDDCVPASHISTDPPVAATA